MLWKQVHIHGAISLSYDAVYPQLSFPLPLSRLGAIQEAVELVNDVDPEILDTNSTLYFHLQQQQLLELIKEVG